MTTRRDLLAGAGLAALATQLPLAALAQAKDSVTIGMTLEPPTLDPTSGAAAPIDDAPPGLLLTMTDCPQSSERRGANSRP